MLEMRDLCLEALSEKSDRDFSDEADLLCESLPLEQRLDELISRGSHFPSPEISDLLKLKCQVHLERKDYRTAAAALVHSQGLLFRHQVLVEYNKRLRRREEERARGKNAVPESERDLFSSSLDEDEDDRDEDRAEKLLRNSIAFQVFF